MRYVVIDQQATDELGGDHLGRAGEEGLRECWEGLGGYGSGLGMGGGYWEGAGICKNRIKALRQSAVAFCDILTISARVEESQESENP